MFRSLLLSTLLLAMPDASGVDAGQFDWISVHRLTGTSAARDIPMVEHQVRAGQAIDPEDMLPVDARPGDAVELRLRGSGRPFVKVLVNRG